MHKETNLTDLKNGLEELNRKLNSRQKQLKDLVQKHFDNFVKCIDIISGIYSKISESSIGAEDLIISFDGFCI